MALFFHNLFDTTDNFADISVVKHNRQIFFYISLPRDHIRKPHLECDLRFVINTLDATTPENAMDTSAIIPYFHINRVIVIVSPISLFL